MQQEKQDAMEYIGLFFSDIWILLKYLQLDSDVFLCVGSAVQHIGLEIK